MPALKPWYRVVSPREDLREGKPLDASEFAVHLDQVRDGRAPTDYQKPERFFDRTYLTQNMPALSAEVVRRLSGVLTETSAVFNLTTQFGGGKTHFLTLLYQLATNGPKAGSWNGVSRITERAGVGRVPGAGQALPSSSALPSPAPPAPPTPRLGWQPIIAVEHYRLSAPSIREAMDRGHKP